MKTKGSNADIAHYWANQVQDNMSNAGGVFFFEKDTIYSYGHHFPIARMLDGDLVLMTTRSYSPTTGQHCSLVHQAIPKSQEVFCVDNVLARSPEDHEANFADYVERFNDMVKQSIRARTNKDWLLDEAANLASQANSYIDAFELSADRLSIDDIDLEDLKERLKAEKSERAKQTKIDNAQRLKDNEEKIVKWRNRESVYLPFNLPCMLRVNDDNQTVETSQGADIPVSFCKRLWRLIRVAVKTKRTITESMQVGHYWLNKISPNGDVVIGCHNIKYDELERIADQLKLNEV